MRADTVPGAVFPDHELPDHRGKHRKLSELQQGCPLVLVLSRGGFCRKEKKAARRLLQLHREMQVGYCRLVTISTDNLLFWATSWTRREQLRTTLPIRRVVGPADIAALAIHLTTNTAVTGAPFNIDGGQQLV